MVRAARTRELYCHISLCTRVLCGECDRVEFFSPEDCCSPLLFPAEQSDCLCLPCNGMRHPDVCRYDTSNGFGTAVLCGTSALVQPLPEKKHCWLLPKLDLCGASQVKMIHKLRSVGVGCMRYHTHPLDRFSDFQSPITVLHKQTTMSQSMIRFRKSSQRKGSNADILSTVAVFQTEKSCS